VILAHHASIQKRHDGQSAAKDERAGLQEKHEERAQQSGRCRAMVARDQPAESDAKDRTRRRPPSRRTCPP
jgi:hypothetical protein